MCGDCFVTGPYQEIATHPVRGCRTAAPTSTSSSAFANSTPSAGQALGAANPAIQTPPRHNRSRHSTHCHDAIPPPSVNQPREAGRQKRSDREVGKSAKGLAERRRLIAENAQAKLPCLYCKGPLKGTGGIQCSSDPCRNLYNADLAWLKRQNRSQVVQL